MAKETTPPEVSRRQFVGTVAAAAAGLTIVPRHVLGAGFQAPSDTVNVAVVGYAHGMGTSNLLNVAKTDNIVALCDCRRERGRQGRPRVRSKTTPTELPEGDRDYKDYRVMLEKQKDIDAVLVATPDHTHALVAMAAMQLGKHVYVQKPLTRTISEARALTEAARKYKVVTQMGNQGHSEEGLRLMQEWFEAGAIGEVREVHCLDQPPDLAAGHAAADRGAGRCPDGMDWDLWLGPAPMRPFHKTYHPFGWRAWQDFGAGAMGDMACHVMDASYTVLKLGAPTSIIATSGATTSCRRPPGQRGCGQRVQYNDSYPPSSLIHLTFPAARRHAAGEAALVRRRPAARAPGRSRAGAQAAGVGHDLRRRQGQDVVRDLLGEPAPHPRDGDAGLPAAGRRRCRGCPRDGRATRRTGSTRSARRARRCRTSTTPVRSPRRVLLGNVALRYPGRAPDVGRGEHEGHQQARGRPVHPAHLPSGLVALGLPSRPERRRWRRFGVRHSCVPSTGPRRRDRDRGTPRARRSPALLARGDEHRVRGARRARRRTLRGAGGAGGLRPRRSPRRRVEPLPAQQRHHAGSIT